MIPRALIQLGTFHARSAARARSYSAFSKVILEPASRIDSASLKATTGSPVSPLLSDRVRRFLNVRSDGVPSASVTMSLRPFNSRATLRPLFCPFYKALEFVDHQSGP